MAATPRKTLAEYLAFDYPFNVIADPEGGYVVTFPDLTGCYTEADTLAELPAAVEGARSLWLATAYDQGIEIPLPSYPDEASGKILVRLPRSLHRRLLDQAGREGVSLNQYTVTLLTRGDAQAGVERRLAAIEQQLHCSMPPLAKEAISAERPKRKREQHKKPIEPLEQPTPTSRDTLYGAESAE